MNKFWGRIGFIEQVETSPDVWTDKITERSYSCEKVKNGSRWQGAAGANDDIVIDNRISILADPYAFDAMGSIKYVIRNGSKWKVTSVEESYPKLVLTLGGLYHG